jgi:hypothetical protein
MGPMYWIKMCALYMGPMYWIKMCALYMGPMYWIKMRDPIYGPYVLDQDVRPYIWDLCAGSRCATLYMGPLTKDEKLRKKEGVN